MPHDLRNQHRPRCPWHHFLVLASRTDCENLMSLSREDQLKACIFPHIYQYYLIYNIHIHIHTYVLYTYALCTYMYMYTSNTHTHATIYIYYIQRNSTISQGLFVRKPSLGISGPSSTPIPIYVDEF